MTPFSFGVPSGGKALIILRFNPLADRRFGLCVGIPEPEVAWVDGTGPRRLRPSLSKLAKMIVDPICLCKDGACALIPAPDNMLVEYRKKD